jgi:hypothetical protein
LSLPKWSQELSHFFGREQTIGLNNVDGCCW